MTTDNQKEALPDIFITGVMKGGTTILHDYISAHPKISAGIQKEIHYFSLHYDKGPQWYADHFKNVEPGIRTIDASPTYFDTTETALVPRLIKAYTPDPRVIVITRDPIERAISQFIHLKVTTKAPPLQNVDIDEFFAQDFTDAFRRTGIMGYYLNLVLSFSLYTRKLVTYQQLFDPHQLLVLDNKELRNDTPAVMKRVYAFLNEDYVADEQFGVIKRSNGSSINQISLETYNKLAELFYPDYRLFCERAGIKFSKVEHSNEQRSATAA